ncbi:MAG: hypothetical protein Phog2KO_44810 [Phototrophicaceae bacterium]
MVNDDQEILEQIKLAIEENNIDRARSLLRPLMERNVVDAFYFASRVAYTQEQALEFLRYALQLDPDNSTVRDSLTELETLYKTQTSLVITDPNAVPVSDDIKAKIDKTVGLFRQYHWDVIVQEDNHAQLVRRQTMSDLNAFVLGLGLHLFGLFLTGCLLATSDKMHVFIEADENDILLSSSKGDMLLRRPEQAIIFLDKTRGTTFGRGVLFALAGLTITTIAYFLLTWQAHSWFDFAMRAIAPEVFLPDI